MKHIRLLLIIICLWQNLAWAKIATQVEPSSIRMGETFRLTITIKAPQADSVPNLIPLQENFTIVGTERSMAYSIVNGQKSSVNQWIILLTPQKTGTLLIPALQVGQEQTTASSIEVTGDTQTVTPNTKNNKNDVDSTAEISLKTETKPEALYINQQAIYSVKLYNSQRLLDAEYIPPQVDDALLIPLGDTQHSQTILNNRGYTIEEQLYAIFPQKSGTLTINPPVFNAMVFDVVPRRMKIAGKTSTLEVKPIPPNYQGKSWLPAKQVALTEIYDQSESTMIEGSTLIRTVTLQASGLPAQLLPILNFDSTSQYNCYPEKPELKNTARHQDVIGRSDTKITYLLNKAGKINIPALQIHWFNTDTNKEEIATLPARTIEIKPKIDSPQQPKTVTPNLAPAEVPANTPSIAVSTSDNLAWWIAGGFALAWLTTLGLWWLRKNTPRTSSNKKTALKALRSACKTNNPTQAQSELLKWAALQWPNNPPLNLNHLAKMIHDSPLKKQLSLLSQALYGQETPAEWQGELLWRSITRYLRKKPTRKSKESGLPPINPV